MRKSILLTSLLLLAAILLAACPAPTIEAPLADVPAAEATATETPADEAVAIEAPADEATATEAPAVEAMAAETPADEVATTEAPAAEATATEAPADEEATSVAESPAEPSAGEDASTPLNAQAAANAALAAVPDSAVVEIGRGTERGRPIWEVVVRNSNGRGTELYIDAATGDVIKQEAAEIPPYARVSAPAITADAAMATALSATPGTVEEMGLGLEGRATVWEVLVAGANGRVEHYIDASTGDIIKQEARRG